MDIINIEGTNKTLDVKINFINGVFNFSGKSLEEDSSLFFSGINLYINSYLNNPADSTMVYVDIEYINSNSIKHLLDMFKLFNTSSMPVTINWVYEENDETIFELGESIEEILNIKLNFIQKESRKK